MPEKFGFIKRGFRSKTGLGLTEKLREIQEGSDDDLEKAGLLEGDPKTVFEAVAQHAQNKEKVKEDDISPIIFYNGGGARGADGSGVAMALQRRRLLGGFDVVEGLSTGASIAASHVTGQAERGSWFYRNIVTSKEFVDRMRFLRGQSIVDVGVLPTTYRGEGRVRPYKTSFSQDQTLIIPVTDFETGEQILVYPTPENIVDVIHASSALPPPAYKQEVRIPHVIADGRRVADGGMSNPMPIQSVCEDLAKKGREPTHIIVVANRARKIPELTFAQRAVENLGKRGWPEGLRTAYERNEDVFQSNLKYLREMRLPYVIIWSDGELSAFDKKRSKISRSILTSFLRTANTLKKYLPKNKMTVEEDKGEA